MNNNATPNVSPLTDSDLKWYVDHSDYFQVAVINEQVEGFLIALPNGCEYKSVNYIWFSNKYDRFMYVDRVVINPRFSGNGIGTSSVRRFAEVRNSQLPRVTCEVNLKPRNDSSLNFHENMGFVQVGTQWTDNNSKYVSLMSHEF